MLTNRGLETNLGLNYDFFISTLNEIILFEALET